MSKLPWFMFYPSDFLTDENVELMDNRQTGCYIRLLCKCWIEGSIPSDIQKIARLCREDGSAMAELWLAIRPCFTEDATKPGRLINPRLEEERLKQERLRTERSASGAKGAKTRWLKGSGLQADNSKGNGSANGSAIAQPMTEPMANDSYSESESESDIRKKDNVGSVEPTDQAPVDTPKKAKPKPPKEEPKFSDDARTLATMIYDDLKADNALPATGDFWVKQAVFAEALLKKRTRAEWEAAYQWGRSNPYIRPNMVNLRYLGDVVWSKYAMFVSGGDPWSQTQRKPSNVILQQSAKGDFDYVMNPFGEEAPKE